MPYIDEQLVQFKNVFERAIIERGLKGKTSVIRSSGLINLIHDAVKYELIQQGVNPEYIHPKLGKTCKELKIAGFLKQKCQDVCVTPNAEKVPKVKRTINWGPFAYKRIDDDLGGTHTEHTLVINIRSQLSSLAKNCDTLFERTFAEAQNLHMKYPNMVLGDVYLIPLYEYDETAMDDDDKTRRIKFKNHSADIENYLRFFHAINNREKGDQDFYKYERCALLIVDFRPERPILYRTNEQLVEKGILSANFPIKLSDLSFDSFAGEILAVYADRFTLQDLKD